MASVWSTLALYENRDLLTKFYRTRHQRDLKESTAHAIIAHLAQGRSYFASAKDASDLVRPLLQYYGTLALARAVILYADQKKGEEALSAAHGVMPNQWKDKIAGGSSCLPDLELKPTKGTFRDLCAATANREYVQLSSGRPPFQSFVYRASHPVEFTESTTIGLKEIWARLPDLADVYWRVFEERPECYLTKVRVNVERKSMLFIFDDQLHIPDDAARRRIFNIRDGCTAGVGEYQYIEPITDVAYQVNYEDRLAAGILPHIVNNAGKYCFLVDPLAKNLRLSSLALWYLVAFASSMLVRYHPSFWLSLVQRQKGDYAFPLMQEAVNLVDEEIPRHILNELEGDERIV